MISIFKAIKLNNVEIIRYLVNLASNSQATTNKDTQTWLLPYLKSTNQKQYNLNRRSTRGKTALHYAITWNRIEIAQILIDCPLVNVNKRDLENGWSSLHRALYLGRMQIVWMLMKREDLDLNIKDWEGYKALELFNTTVSDGQSIARKLDAPIMDTTNQMWLSEDDTSSNDSSSAAARTTRCAMEGGTDLYTWGMNVTYMLGHLDTENRSRPERVNLRLESQQDVDILHRPPYLIQSVHMSKFHMAVVTSETVHNLLVCGFGRGGRLGTGKDTDAQLAPVAVHWPERIAAVALGRDHTIAVTVNGSVITFGNNDYGQLGYDTDERGDGYSPQLYPRKLQAPILRKQPIIGVAASKVHSVAYTSTEIFTFGYNQGQLGYRYLGNDRRQTTPRKIAYSSKILQVEATEYATIILFDSHDVVVLANFETQKLLFDTSRFPSNIAVHSPAKSTTIKLISGGHFYSGAISNLGDVYIWTCKPATPATEPVKQNEHLNRSKQQSIIISKPRRVWTGSRSDMAAVDASIGRDGEIIICTASGCVYVGGVSKESAKESSRFKFHRVPQLQRCIAVCANPNGAYSAIRSEFQSPLPPPRASSLASDMLQSLPCMAKSATLKESLQQIEMEKKRSLDTLQSKSGDSHRQVKENDCNGNSGDENQEMNHLVQQVEGQCTSQMKRTLNTAWKQLEQHKDATLDICFWVQGKPIYAHLCIFQHRRTYGKSNTLFSAHADENTPIIKTAGHIKFIVTNRQSSTSPCKTKVIVEGCHLLSFFILLEYIYCDTMSFFSTQAVPELCSGYVTQQNPDIQDVRYDLIQLSAIFGLSHLHNSVSSTYLPSPPPTLRTHLSSMIAVSDDGHSQHSEYYRGDVQLLLKGGIIICDEVILRQRCPFFACLFNPNMPWVDARRRYAQRTCVDLEHHSVETMLSVVNYVYADPQVETELLTPSSIDSTDDAVQFLIRLLGASDEFLLPGLKVLCERALIPMINLRNVVIVFEYAHLYLASSLKLACMSLIQANMSSFVIAGLLEQIEISLIRDLETFVQQRQDEYLPTIHHCDNPTASDDSNDLGHILDDDESEDDDLRMALSTWAHEEVPITTGYIEYLETIRPALNHVPTLKAAGKRTKGGDRELAPMTIPQEVTKSEKSLDKKSHAALPIQMQALNDQKLSGSSASVTPPTANWNINFDPSESNQTQKLSLRDVLEKENAELAATFSPTVPKLSIGTNKKLSQKEKRKLQKQESTSTSSSALTSAPEAKMSAWATIPVSSSPPHIGKELSAKSLNEADAVSAFPKPETIASRRMDIKGATSKGKKIYTKKEILLEEQNQGWKRAHEVECNSPKLFDLERNLGNAFALVPVTPLSTVKNNTASSSLSSSSSSSSSGLPTRKSSSSFYDIQQEQRQEDEWIKGKRKRNLVLIQREESAMVGLKEFYIQTLERGSGEWVDIHPEQQ